MTARRSGPRSALWVTLAVIALVVVIALAGAVWYTSRAGQAPAAAPDTVGTRQSLAVAAFLKAYVKDDAATMEKLVTPTSVPWTAAPPALPAGVSTDTVASFIEPFHENGQVVIGNPLVLEVRMTGDGREPTGTVTARISTRKQAARTVMVGMVLDNGTWLVDTIDGVPAVKAAKALTP